MTRKIHGTLTYSGEKLEWGSFRWNASSGKVLAASAAEKVPGESQPVSDFQFTKFQHISDRGPIPEGTYLIPLKDGGTATTFKSRGSLHYDKQPEIQSMECVTTPNRKEYVAFNHDWGKNRVRLITLKISQAKARHRGGFYIHDSIKGYSSGCIEVAHGFFAELRRFAKTKKNQGFLKLIVKYSGTETYGGTWIQGSKLKERSCPAL